MVLLVAHSYVGLHGNGWGLVCYVLVATIIIHLSINQSVSQSVNQSINAICQMNSEIFRQFWWF